jgi:ParB family chromosome partitioning protein
MSVNNIGLKSYEDLFKDDKGRKTEEIVPIKLSELKPFEEQPFKVLDNDEMNELVESIKENGVLSPIVVRPHPEGGYEILSGHRRAKACEKAGISEVPVVIKDLDDDTAVILLVDSNLQREHILPSEKAFAYQMKLEAMKRKAGRPSKENGAQLGNNFEGKKSVEIMAETSTDSRNQIQRFIRLTELIDPILEMVDNKQIAMN